MHYPPPANPSSGRKSAPWFYLFLAALALTAWLTTSLRDTEAKLSRTAERLALTESRLEKSRTEVRDLRKSVDEVKEMVSDLVGDDEGAQSDEEEFVDEEEGEDGPYLANQADKLPVTNGRQHTL
jgi:hypothetical protein